MDINLQASRPPTPSYSYSIIWNTIYPIESPQPLPSTSSLAPLLQFNNVCFALVVEQLQLRDLVHLKLVGNSVLWHKIQLCTRVIAFTPDTGENRRVAPVLFLNPFRLINSFPYLETLLLHRVRWNSTYESTSPLLNLPSTLKTLLLSVVTTSIEIHISRGLGVDFISLCPHLESLSIFFGSELPLTEALSMDWLFRLPKTIRVLSAIRCFSDPGQALVLLNHPTSCVDIKHSKFILPMLEVLQLDSKLGIISSFPVLIPTLRVLGLVDSRDLALHQLLPSVPTLKEDAAPGLTSFYFQPSDRFFEHVLNSLPCCSYELEMNILSSQIFPLHMIQSTLRHLVLGGFFLDALQAQSLPQNLESLVLGNYDEAGLVAWLLKATRLKKLWMKRAWESPSLLANALPPSLEDLSCSLSGNDLNDHQRLFRALPKTLKILDFLAIGFWESAFILLPPSIEKLCLFSATYFSNTQYNQALLTSTLPLLKVLVVRAPPRTSNFRVEELKDIPKSLQYVQLSGMELSPKPIDEKEVKRLIQHVASHFPPGCVCDIPFYIGRTQVPRSIVQQCLPTTWLAIGVRL